MRLHNTVNAKSSTRKLHKNHKYLRKLIARLQHDLQTSEVLSTLKTAFPNAEVSFGPTTDTRITPAASSIVWQDQSSLIGIVPITNVSYQVLTVKGSSFDDIDKDFVTTCILLLFAISIGNKPGKRTHWLTDRLQVLQNIPLSNTILLKNFTGDILEEYTHLLSTFVQPPTEKQTNTILQLDEFEAQIIEALVKVIKWSYVEKTCVFFERHIQDVAIVVHNKTAIVDCLIPMMMNALENTLQGSVVVRYSTDEFGNLILDVKDTGCGACNTTSPQAHANAEALNGSIDLVTSSPRGSIFRIVLKDLAFATSQTHSISRDHSGLPPSYCLLQPTGINVSGVKAFLRMLDSLGLKETSEIDRHVLVVVPFCPLEGDYEQLLTKGREALACISLVPNRADITDMRAKFPETLFYTCPFTTMRMTEMLTTLSDVCAAYSGQRTSACGSARSSIMQAHEL